ncbi:hypothetical protein ABW20_dc0100407 [Dactylellina cionopaga]|nr:hypothetical protein ABW20_dc0100407 [Dactylellina cionopaga]
MAVMESPAQQQQYLDLHDPVQSLAGPSSTSSTSSPALQVDDLRRGKLVETSAAPQSSNNGPTPPSSPSQHGHGRDDHDTDPAEQAVMFPLSKSLNTANTVNSVNSVNNVNDEDVGQADISSSAALTSLGSHSPPTIQQQPTPPSTLPEDAAFPQAAMEQNEHALGENQNESSSPDPIREPYVVEHDHHQQQQQPSDTRSTRSPVASARSPASSVSTLNDGVPTLDANEAAFLLEADSMDNDQENEPSANVPPPPPPPRNDLPSLPPATQDLRPNLSRNPSTSSHQSTLPGLPTLQIPLHSPPVPFQPHQTGSQYSFPYATPLPGESRFSSSTLSEQDQRPPMSPEVPPWQPDSEVNNCPICTTAFSFFYRKHHCRKCGRVVCAPCSPHRIVIPKSFVVYPPNAIDLDQSQSYVDSSGNRRDSYVGDTGVEVRICNNCLAGENPSAASTGPQTTNQARRQSMQSPGGAGRFWQDGGPSAGGNGNSYAQLQNVNFGGNNAPRRRAVSSAVQAHGGPHAAAGYPGAVYHHYGPSHSLGRNHSHGFPGQLHPPYHSHPAQQQPPLQHPTPSYPLPQPGHPNFSFAPAQFYPSPQPLPYHHQHQGHQRSASSSHAYSQYSPVNQPIRGLLDTSQQPVPAFSMPDTSRPHLPIANQFMPNISNRELQTHSAPPQPQPRLKETDYCPICMTVLPPPNPVTKDEIAREAHIQQCIDNAVSGTDVTRRRSTSGTPNSHASLANTTMSSQPAAHHQPISHASSSNPPGHHHNNHHHIQQIQPLQPQLQNQFEPSSRRSRASSRPSGGRMVVYTATEKDTFALGNDAEADGQKAECVICFEEFEAGDAIARLECFCRYHKKCITDWFNRRGDGQCPVHAMNE